MTDNFIFVVLYMSRARVMDRIYQCEGDHEEATLCHLDKEKRKCILMARVSVCTTLYFYARGN